MNSQNQNILVFSGPSGGHLFPAQAFAEAAQEAGLKARLILVTSIRARGLCAPFSSQLFAETVYLPEFGLPAGFSLSSFKLLFSIPLAAIQSWRLISRFRPVLCVGFGSFVSYFGILFASWKHIPILIHEQNQVPGKATRMLQHLAEVTLTSFPQTRFPKAPKKQIFTGLPIRRQLRQGIISVEKKKASPFTVLVCGGSQGSAFLNDAVLKAFSLFSPEERASFAVIHITGTGQEKKVEAGYAELQIPAEVYPFLGDMNLAYNRAHIAISRAGANSGFEQALYGLPTAFVPYPYAEGHQNDNAQYFVENGGARTLVQNQETAEGIAGVLREWKGQSQSYWTASRNMLALAQNAGHALVLAEVTNRLTKK